MGYGCVRDRNTATRSITRARLRSISRRVKPLHSFFGDPRIRSINCPPQLRILSGRRRRVQPDNLGASEFVGERETASRTVLYHVRKSAVGYDSNRVMGRATRLE